MRKTLTLFLGLLIISCSESDDIVEELEKSGFFTETLIACETEELGIGSNAKRFLSKDEVFFVVDTVWQWYRKDENLQIQFSYGCGDECSNSRIMNFKIQDSCLVLTENYNSRGDVFDGTERNFYEINFELQEFNETRIIGKNMDTKFWVEFEESAELN